MIDDEWVDRLVCKDCFEVMDEMPGKSIPLILSDPPYGTTQNEYDEEDIDVFELFRQYNRIVRDNGAIVLTCAEPFTSTLITIAQKFYRYKYIWVKSKATNWLNCKKQPMRKFEEVVVFYKKQPTYNPRMWSGTPYDKGVRKDQRTGSYGDFAPVRVVSEGARYPVDVLYFPTAESEPERTVWHPNQKPIALMEYMVDTYTNPGDLVLDNFAGAGTTPCACILSGRHYLGVDNKQKWIDVAAKRTLFWSQNANHSMYWAWRTKMWDEMVASATIPAKRR